MHFYTPTRLALSACVIGAAATLCEAQWTDDSAANTPLISMTGDQVQPKMVATPDGGAYVSWFDNRVGGFDVYMQRINADGEPQWAADGVLIAERSFSSTQDYDLTIDSDGHAVVAFRDDRFGGVVVTASRIALDGTQVWGPDGVQPSLTGPFIGAIRVAGTTDGRIAVGWYNGNAARVVKLDTDGDELWATDIGSAPTGDFTVSDLVVSDGARSTGEVVVLMTTIGGFSTPRHLYAQKLDADGNLMWAAPSEIHTGSSLQIGNFPGGVTDGAGGIVTAWYETSPLDVRAQHVDADGVIQFPAGGAQASTDATSNRVSPNAAYDASTGETYVFWHELTALQEPIGVYGQKFNTAGLRQWTDTGISIFDSTSETTQARTLLHENGAQVYFAERLTPTVQRLLGAFVDSDGGIETAVSDETFDLSTAESSKSRLTAIRTSDDMAVLLWQDNRSGTEDLYAQNVNADGSLGTACPIVGDLDCDQTVDAEDLFILLGQWGKCSDPDDCPADLDGSGDVGTNDLFILLANWG